MGRVLVMYDGENISMFISYGLVQRVAAEREHPTVGEQEHAPEWYDRPVVWSAAFAQVFVFGS